MSTNRTRSNKPMDLLVALGVNDEVSKKNINTYIERLKNINTFTVNLDVKGFNTNPFIEYEQQIIALQQQLNTLNSQIQNIGSESSPTLSQFEEFKQQITTSVNSIAKFNEAVDDSNINVKQFYKHLANIPTGDLQSLEQLVKQLKNEVEKVSFNHFQLNGVQETQQSLQNLETTLSNFYALYNGYANNTDFEQLTAQITDLNSQITDIQFGEGFNIAGISEISSQLEKINQGIIGFNKNTIETAQSSTSLTDTLVGAIETTTTLKETFSTAGTTVATFGRSLLSATGIGLGLMAVDFVIGKISESIAKAKQKAEDLKVKQEEILNSYIAHSDEIDGLVSRYTQLEEAMALGNTDTSILAEYRDVSNQLAEFLPHLVTGEDEFGNKIVGSSEALKVKIGLLKEQQVIAAQLAEQATNDERDDNIKTRNKTISKLEKKQKNIPELATNKLSDYADTNPNIYEKVNFRDSKGKSILKTSEDYDSKIKELTKLQSNAENSGDSQLANYYENLNNQVKHYKEEIVKNERELNQEILAQKSDYIDIIGQTISENDKLSESVKSNAEGFAAQLIAATDAGNLNTLQESLTTLFSNPNADSFISDITTSFQNMDNATADTFDSMASETKDKISTIKGELSKLGLSENEVGSIMNSLNGHFNNTISTQKELSVEMRANHLTFAEAKAKTSELKEEVKQFQTVYEQLAGVEEKQVKHTDDLLFQYDALTKQLGNYSEQTLGDILNKDELTTEEQFLKETLNKRMEVMRELSATYPNLLENDSKLVGLSPEKISAIENENKAYTTLLKAYKLYNDEKLTEDQKSTIAFAQFALERIKVLKAELSAILLLKASVQDKYDEASENFNKNSNSKSDKEKNSYTYGYELSALGRNLSVITAKEAQKNNEITEAQKVLNNSTNEVENIIKSVENSSKVSKTNNNTLKESIYITDKYKESLENLNLEIAKQVKLQSSLPKHSEEYRKSLQVQLELEKNKLSLIESQEKSLKSQIASGKINKTGTVSNSSTTSTSSTTQKLSGWSGKISSNYGNRVLKGKSDNHRGIDIAMPQGTKLDANISGKVIASGKAGKDNNYHSSYGNIVVIQDANNLKHIYAHLEKAVAKIGSTVEVGEQIGTIGSTGNSTGSHLHYEINKNNQTPIDPTNYLNNARSGTITSTTAVETTQQAIDQAKSELINVQNDILNQKELIAKIEKDIIDSQLSHFDWRRENIQSNLDYEDAKLKLVDKSSSRYTKTIDLQTKYLEQKQTVNTQELNYLEGLIKDGSLSAITLDEMKSRLMQLKTEMLETNNAISQLALNKLETFNYQRSMPESQLEYENAKIKELDTNSARYAKTLQLMTIYMNQKQKVNRSELNYLQQQIASGKHSGEVLEQLKERFTQLTTEVKSLDIEIREKNYEIIVNIKTQFDEKNSNLQFEIERSKIIQSMYEIGSADSKREIDFQVLKTKESLKLINEEIATLKKQLLQFSLKPEDRKSLEKDLQALHLHGTKLEAELKSYDELLIENAKKVEDDLVNKLINAYKNYIQEKRDAHIKSIDDEIKRENERHDAVMDNYKDEMDLFRKNIQDKLKLIDQQEAQRNYDQDINNLEQERHTVQGQYNLLLLDNSHEAKAKRKKLQEQLQQIDDEISEKRHDREIELRKESLNEQLETKENEISQKEELENEFHEKELSLLDDKKKYWEQYYTDKLNDERKFQEIRSKIQKGEFASLKQEFEDFNTWLKETMPDLEITLTGSMDKVGTSIRQNIIEELKKAIDLIDSFETSTQQENGNYGSSSNSNAMPNNSTLIEGDMQVLLGKFMTDVLANQTDNPIRKANIIEKAHKLANEGRKNNSQISKDVDFTYYIKSQLTDDDLVRLSKYFAEQAKTIVITPELQDAIKNQAENMRVAGTQYYIKNSASALQGGMTNFSSNGIDGLGGKAMIVHPNELIHSPIDTNNLLSMANIMERASSFFSPLLSKIPPFNTKLSTVQSASTATYGNINIEFNIDKMNGDMNDLNKFSKMINDNLLRKKGMRT